MLPGGPQVLRIPQQSDQRVVDGGKQELEHHRHSAQPQVMELRRDGKDDMIMLAG
jgi:hypothetical protein